MKIRELIASLNDWAPENYAEKWDNVGLQIGEYEKNIENIMLALDFDHLVFKEARDRKIDLIISHHPFLFKDINKINDSTYKGRLIIKMIREDLALYTMHTNLDRSLGGLNLEMAKLLDLDNIDVLIEDQELSGVGYGSIGEVDKIQLEDFINNTKKILGFKRAILYGSEYDLISKVAIVGGSGASFIEDAYNKGADLYITGDIKYHDAQKARDLGLNILDIGHFESEKIILNRIKEYLLAINKDFNIYIYDKPSPIYRLY